ncbi:MAG: DsbA family protein, partial [Hyphomicrobium sp.]
MADTSPSSQNNEPTGRPSRLAVAALVIAVALSAGFLLLGPLRVGTVAADTSMFTDPQKRGIEQIVKEYLLQNPQVLIEVQGALEQKMAQEEADRTKALVAENAKEIYRHPDAPVAGNPKGDITVVE